MQLVQTYLWIYGKNTRRKPIKTQAQYSYFCECFTLKLSDFIPSVAFLQSLEVSW